MSLYKYPEKTKQIKIFSERERKDPQTGETFVERHYIHPKDQFVYAYMRQLSARETNEAKAVQDAGEIEVVINYREVKLDMFINYQGRIFQIISIDGFELRKTEVKLRVVEVNPRDYRDVTDERWGT